MKVTKPISTSNFAGVRYGARTTFYALVMVGLVIVAPAAASINDLVAFLDRAEAMSSAKGAVEAEVEFHSQQGKTGSFVMVIDGVNHKQLIWNRASGYRAVTPLAWEPGGVEKQTKDSKPNNVSSVDQLLGTSGLRGIAFFPFWKTDYSSCFISDNNTEEKTVSLYPPKERPYQLFVISFDKVKLVPRLIKYYSDSFTHLVRIRIDSDHVLVGTRPRPTKIKIRDYENNDVIDYTLKWKKLDETPADLMSWTGD